MYRNRAYRRHMAITKAVRKRKIDKDRHAWSRIIGWVPYYDNLHQYSKNKIHCSCPLCSAKSKDSLKHSDLQKMEAAKQELKEYEEELEVEVQESSN